MELLSSIDSHRGEGKAGRLDEWIRFSDSQPGVVPFCEPCVWDSWLETHPDCEAAIFERRGEEGLTALLPMYRRGNGLFMIGESHLDYQDLIAVSVDEAVEAVRDAIEHCLRHHLTLSFNKVAENSLLQKALDHPRVKELAWIQSRYWSHCTFASFARTSEDSQVSAFPRGCRRSYRVSVRRLGEVMPELKVSHLMGAEITEDLIEQCAELHLASRFGQKGQSIFVEPGFRNFLKRLAASESKLTLSMAWEKEGGDLLSFTLGFFSRDIFYYYMTSYDQRIASMSPGNWLLVDALKFWARQVQGERLHFDLLSGNESYKSRWSDQTYQVNRIQVIPKQLRNLPRVTAFSSVYRLKSIKNRCLGLAN